MAPSTPPLDLVARSAPLRWLWITAGFLLVGVGFVGAFLPVLPSTVFFLGAAWCFARGSARWLRWLLALPRVGPMVQDYRNGLGMPRRSKVVVVALIALAAGSSALFAVPHPAGQVGTAVLGLIGMVYVATRVPTRENVLAARAAASPLPGGNGSTLLEPAP